MGKGGGKCASRERSGSSVASRTPRLPAKPHHVTPHQSSAKAKDVDRAADTDSVTLEPFIPKKMGSSQVEEDDDIDTNVMFDQQEIHSHVSDSGRRLLGSPSSAVQSAYNTAMPSPSRSFSSGGGRSPDAFHDAPDELQHFQASPNHPRHIKSGVGASQQGGVIANTSQSSFESTRPRFQDDDDLFPSKETIIPTSSNNSAVVHLGLRKRATPFHATPSESKNVSSACNTEAPIVGGSGEETSSPITIISQTSFGLPQPQLGVTPQPHEPSEQATNIEVATPPNQKVDMKEGVYTQESTMPRESGKLSDNWELVPRELGSGSSSPVLVTMSKSTKASVDPTSQLEAMKTENFKNLKFKEKEIEDDSQQPTNEQEENMKSMASKPFLSEHVVEGLPKEKSDPRQLQNDQPFEEEADTVRSLGSDQSDDIETHSINGDGGGYVFLGSPQHEESHDIEKLKDDKDFNKGVPIETLEQIEQRGHVQELPHVPIEKEEEPKEAKPTFEEAAHSLGFPTNPPIEGIQKDAILEALVEIPPPTQGKEPKIQAPIEEPKTSIQDDEALIVVEQKEAPIETLDHIKKHVDVLEPLEVAFEKKAKPKEVEPSLQEAPHSLQLPISPPIEETQKDVTLEVPEQILPPTKMEEPKIEALIEEPQVLDEVTLDEEIEAQEKEAPALEEPYVPSTKQPQDEDVQPTSIEEDEDTLIVKEKTSDPIQGRDEPAQDDDVNAPFKVPIEHRVEPKDVEPSFQEVPRSIDLPIPHPIEETQGDVGVETLLEGQHIIKEEESKIDTPITEPQILLQIEAQEKETPTLEEPYVPFTKQPQDEDVQPTSIEQKDTPLVKEETTDPIQRLHKLPQYDDVNATSEVPIEHKVEPQDVQPNFEEVPKSFDLPITHLLEETQGDVRANALQEGQHVIEEKESKIDAPITEPQIPPQIEAQDKEASAPEEPYVASNEQPQDEDVQPTFTEDQETALIAKEETTDPIQSLDKLTQNNDLNAPFQVPTKHRVELDNVEPSFEEVPRSLDLPIIYLIDETQGDSGVETLQKGQHVVEEEESKIDAPITEPQIPPQIEAQDKESPALEEPYVPSIQEPQHEDIQPTYLEDEQEAPIIKEGTSDPIQGLDKHVEQDDVNARIEVPTEHGVERKDVQPNFEEVPRSLDLPPTNAVATTQGDVGLEPLQGGQDVVEEEESTIETPITEPQIPPHIEPQDKEVSSLEEPYVPSTEQAEHEDIQPTYLHEQQDTPIIKEGTTYPIQRLDKLVEDDDTNAPIEVQTEHGVEREDVQPSFEEVPPSLDLPPTDAVETTQGDAGVEALQASEDVVEKEEAKVEAPITEPQIPPHIEPQDKEVSSLEEPYVPSREQAEHEDVQPTYLEEQQDTPIIKEGTTDPIQRLDKLVEDDDTNAPIEVQTEHGVEREDVQPSFEEVPPSLDLPPTDIVETTQGDAGVEALQASEDVVEEEESKIEAPITEPQIPPHIEAHDQELSSLEEPYVPSTQESQHQDIQPTYLEEEQNTPIIKERTSDPIQGLDNLVEDDDVNAPIEVPTSHRVEHEDVEPSFEEVPRSLNLPTTRAIETTQGDLRVEALEASEDVVEEEESKIEAPITEPQIPPHIEAHDQELSSLEEPYVPSTEQVEHEDVQPTYVEEDQDTPIIKEGTTDPIQRLDKLVEDDDTNAPIEVPTEHGVERQDAESSFEEVPQSLDHPPTDAVETTQGDVGVEALQEDEDVIEKEESKIRAPITEPQIPPHIDAQDKEALALEEPYVPSTQEAQHQDIQPTYLEEEQNTPIIKERTSDPIQGLDNLVEDDDVNAPIEVPTQHGVEREDVEPSFEEVPRSLDLPVIDAVETTQGDVGVEALDVGQDVVEEEESKIEAPITDTQIRPHIEAQDKESPTLEDPYVPSTQEPQHEDIQPTYLGWQQNTPIIEEGTSDPIQGLDKLVEGDDVYAPIEVPTEHGVEHKHEERGFEEVPRSLDLPATHVVETTQGDLGAEALEEGQDVVEEEESKIQPPITEPKIPPHIEPQDKEVSSLEEPYVPSRQQAQHQDVQRTYLEDEQDTPIIKEGTSDLLQGLDELVKHDDVIAPIDVPREHGVEPEDVEPSFEEVPRSLDLQATHAVETTQGDLGVEALDVGQDVVEEEESKIQAPITEPRIPHHIEAQDKEVSSVEEQYVPSTEQAEHEDVQPTYLEEEQDTPIIKEGTSDPIQGLDKLVENDDTNAPIEVPTEHGVEREDVEPSFEEVPRSLDLPTNNTVETTQGDVGVEALQGHEDVIEEEKSKFEAPITEPQIPHHIEAQDKEVSALEEPYVPSREQAEHEDVQPTYLEEQQDTPIIEEGTINPIQRLDKLVEDDDTNESIEVPTEHAIERHDVKPSFQEVPRSLDLPATYVVETTQGDVGVKALQVGEDVVEGKESKIEAPITEPQIPPQIQAQHKELPTLQEPYVPSTQEPQHEDIQPKCLEEQQDTPIIEERTSDPNQGLDKLVEDDEVNAPIEVPTQHGVEHEDVHPSFEEVPRSLDLPAIHTIETSQRDVGVEALEAGQDVVDEEESIIEAPITEAQIPPHIEAHDKEVSSLQEPYVPSTEQAKHEDVQPTYLEEEQDTPIIKEGTSDPIQGLEKLVEDDDMNAQIEVPTEHGVERQDVEPSFQEVPQSVDDPATHAVETTQGDVGVEALQAAEDVVEEEESKIEALITEPQIPPHIKAQDKKVLALEEAYVASTQEAQHEDVLPTYLEEQQDTPTIKEGTSDPIQGLDKLVEDDDVNAPIEVPTEHGVKPEDVEPSIEEVPRSLDLPATHADETTQGDVGVEALHASEDVVEEEESKIEAPIPEPQIPSHIEAQDEKVSALQEPYVPSKEQPEHEDVQTKYLEEQQDTPIIEEGTSDPIQGLDKLVEDDDVNAQIEVPKQHGVEGEDVEPSFQEVPQSIDLPATHAVETSQGDIGVEALEVGQDVVEDKESNIEAPHPEPQIPPQIEVHDKEWPALEEAYVPSTQEPEHEDIQPTYLEEQQDTPIIDEKTNDPIQRLDKLLEDDDVTAPIEVPKEHGVKREDVEPSFEEVPRSLNLPTTHAVELTQGDVGVEALQVGEDVVKEKETKIEAPITEPQIPPHIEAQDKEVPTPEDPYVPSTQEAQHEDVPPTYLEEEQDIPIIKEGTNDPIQALDKLVEDDDVNAPIELPTEHGVEPEDVEPSIEEVQRSIDLPAPHAVETTKGDVGLEALQAGADVVEEEESKIEPRITEPQIPPHIEAQDKELPALEEPYLPSTQEPQHEDIQPTYLGEQQDTPIIEEGTSDPIQRLEKLVEDDDVIAPIEVPTEHGVEREDVEPSIEEVPRSLDLPATPVVETTQGVVGVEALQVGEDVVKRKESKIKAPITEPQIPPQIEAQDKESPALEDPYVPSTQEPQHEDIQPTYLEEQQDTPIIKERTSDPNQGLDKLVEDDDVTPPIEVPTKHGVEHEHVEPSFEEVPRSLNLPATHNVQTTQADVGVEALQGGEDVIEEKESKIAAPITKPQIPPQIEAKDKQSPALEEPYVPSIQEPQHEDIQPTYLEEQQDTPIIEERTSDPNEGLDKLGEDDDVTPPIDVPTEHWVEREHVEASFEEVPRSLDLLATDAVETTQGDVGVETLQGGEHVVEEEESKIETPTTEPQIPPHIEAQDKEVPALDKPYLPSSPEAQHEDVPPTYLEEEQDIPTIKEGTSDPIQGLDKLVEDDDVNAPIEVPLEHRVEHEVVEPSVEEEPRSLDLPTTHAVETTQGDVGMEALQAGQDVVEEEEKSKIEAPITEPQIPLHIEAQDKESPALEKPYVRSTQEPQHKDIQPAYLEEQQDTPIIDKGTSDPIQGLDKLVEDDVGNAPIEVPTEHGVEREDVEPSFEEVPRSLDLPTTHAVETTQGDVGVEALHAGEDVVEEEEASKIEAPITEPEIPPQIEAQDKESPALEKPYVPSTQEPQHEEIQATYIEEQQDTPIIEERASDPIQGLDKIVEDDHVNGPIEVATEHGVEREDVEPSFEEVPRSLDLPATHVVETNQGDVGVEALQGGEDVVEEEESKIEPPITEPQIPPHIEAKFEEVSALQEPYVPSTEQPEHEDVQPIYLKEQQDAPSIEEETSAPIKGLDKLGEDDDVTPPIDVPTEHWVEREHVEPSIEEVPQSLDLPATHVVETTQGDVGVEALQVGEHVVKEEESEIEAPISEPQIPRQIEAQDKESLALEEPYVPSTQEPQHADIQPTYLEEQQDTPIIDEGTSDPNKGLNKLVEDDDVNGPIEVQIEHGVEHNDADRGFQEVPRSIDLPATHAVETTQGDVGVEALQGGEDVVEEQESKIEAPIAEPQIPPHIEAQDKEVLAREEPYVPSTQEAQHEDVPPTYLEEEQDTPTIKEGTRDPIQGLHKLVEDYDVNAPIEVPKEHAVEREDVESSIEEVPRSIDLPGTDAVETTHGDVGVEALEAGEDVIEEEESKIEAPITEPQIPPHIEAQDKESPAIEGPYVLSTQELQHADIQPTYLEEEQDTPTIEEGTNDPIQGLDKLVENDDVNAPIEVPTEHGVEHEDVEPSIEEVPRSLDLPATHGVETTQGDVGVEALQGSQNVVEEDKESKIRASITEPQIPPHIEAQDKEVSRLEEPYVPSTEQAEHKDVQRTYLEEEQDTPIIKERTSDPIRRLDKPVEDDDVNARIEVPTQHEVEREDVEPSYEEVPRSLDLPTTHAVETTKGDVGMEALQAGEDVVEQEEESKIQAPITEPQIPPQIEAQDKESPALEEPYVPSTQEPQHEDIQATYLEEQQDTPIIEEKTNDPIQGLHKLVENDDVNGPIEVPTEHGVERQDVELSFEEVPRSLDLPATHAVETNKGDVGVEALQGGEDVVEEKESKIEAPITEPQIPSQIEAQDKEVSALQGPYVPSTEQPEHEDVQPTYLEEQQDAPSIQEETTAPIQGLDKLVENDDVNAPIELPTEHGVEPKDVEPSIEDVPRSTYLPATHVIETTQGDVGFEALQAGEDVVEEEESKIEAPITEPQIPPHIQAHDKELRALEEQHVPSTQEPKHEDIQPTYFEEQQGTPIIEEGTSDPIQGLNKLVEDDHVTASIEVPTQHGVEREDVEPSFEEVPRSLDLPATHAPYVPSIQEPQHADIQPIYLEEHQDIPIIEEGTSDPNEGLNKLVKDDHVNGPIAVQTEHGVKHNNAYRSFEEGPRSIGLPATDVVQTTQGDVGVEALQGGEDVVEEQETKIEAPITEPQIPPHIEAQDKEVLTLEEPYVPSTQEAQHEDVPLTYLEEEQDTPIIKEATSDPIQGLDKHVEDYDVNAPIEVPKEHAVEPEDVESSIEEVPRSIDLSSTDAVETTHGDVGVEALEAGEDVVEEQESKIEAPITEPQIPPHIEAQDKESPSLEEPYVLSTQEPQHEDIQPTYFEEQQDTQTIEEGTSDPIQGLDKLVKDDDVNAPIEVPTEHGVEREDVEPSIEEVPRSLDLPATHDVGTTQGDVGVKALQGSQNVVEEDEESKIKPSIREPQIPSHIEAQDKEVSRLEEPYVPSTKQGEHENTQRTYLEEQQDTPIIKEGTSVPIQRLDKLVEDDDVNAPIEVPTEHGVETEDVEPSFEEVPRSLNLPATHAVQTTQGDIGVEAFEASEDVVEEEESKIEAPITEPQIPPQIEAYDKESPTLEEAYVPSTQEPQHEDIQPAYLEEEPHTPIIEEGTSDPIQGLGKLVEDDDVNAPIEVQTQQGVESEDVEPSIEEVPRSLHLSTTQAVETTQGDVGVEALQGGEAIVEEEEESKIEAPITEAQLPPHIQAQDKQVSRLEEPYVPSTDLEEHEDVQPTYPEEEQDTPIIKEGTSDPIQGLDKLVGNDDVNAPIEVPTQHGVQREDVGPNFEEVPRSIDLPATHTGETSHGDVGVEALEVSQDVVEEEESNIEAPIPEPQIPPQIEAHDKESPALEEAYVPSTQEPQHQDIQPTYIEEQPDTPIIEEGTSDPIKELDKHVEQDDVNAPIEVPKEHGLEREDVEPSFEEVPRSLDLPATHAVETTQGDIGVEALEASEDVVEGEESKIEAPITEPQIPPQIEVYDKESPTLEEAYVPSTQEPQHEDIQPAYLEEEPHTPIIEEGTSDPIQGLGKLVEDDDVNAPIEVPTQHGVESEDVEPSIEEVPRSIDLPATHIVETSQGDVGVETLEASQDVVEEEESNIEAPIPEPQIPPQIEAHDKELPALEEAYVPSTQEPQHQDIQPTYLEEQPDTQIIEEATSDPIQGLYKHVEQDDVNAPIEVPKEHGVKPEDVEPSFEKVPRSLDLSTTHTVQTTQGDVRVEALEAGEDIVEGEESKIEAPITEPQIPPQIEAYDKESPALEEAYKTMM
ncbi:unnamed protein product [Sphagnum jensenii]|uniref:Uncharacterized protein n=1 Tax=Sphagnum jensenii TaxID=128206 RepID=A0ABP1AZ98_9BRYO